MKTNREIYKSREIGAFRGALIKNISRLNYNRHNMTFRGFFYQISLSTKNVL